MERRKEREIEKAEQTRPSYMLTAYTVFLYNLLWDTFLGPDGFIWVTATTAAVPEAENMHKPSLAKKEWKSVRIQLERVGTPEQLTKCLSSRSIQLRHYSQACESEIELHFGLPATKHP